MSTRHDSMATFIERTNEMEAEVNKAIANAYVTYSAYGHDENDDPVNNLHDVAIKGRVIVVSDPDQWDVKGNSELRSKVMHSPTWLDLTKFANETIYHSGDKHHIFFEGVEKTRRRFKTAPKTPVYYVVMGS